MKTISIAETNTILAAASQEAELTMREIERAIKTGIVVGRHQRGTTHLYQDESSFMCEVQIGNDTFKISPEDKKNLKLD